MTKPIRALAFILATPALAAVLLLPRLAGFQEGAALPAAAHAAEPLVEAAPETVRGALSSAALKVFAHANVGTSVVAVVLHGADLASCEDLPRQLRELKRRSDPRFRLVILTEPASVERLTAFARRERIQPYAVLPLAPESVLSVPARLATPAVLVTRDQSGRVEGVGHPRRQPNLRIRSFADELGMPIRKPVPAGPGGSHSTKGES